MSNSGTRVVRSAKPLTTISESIPNTSLTEISSVGFAFMSMLPSAIGAILHFTVCLNSCSVVQHIARKGKGKGKFCIGLGAYHVSLAVQGDSEPNGDSRGHRRMACRLHHGGQACLWRAVFRDLCETIWHLPACLGQPCRGRRGSARRLCENLAQCRSVSGQWAEPHDVADHDCAECCRGSSAQTAIPPRQHGAGRGAARSCAGARGAGDSGLRGGAPERLLRRIGRGSCSSGARGLP